MEPLLGNSHSLDLKFMYFLLEYGKAKCKFHVEKIVVCMLKVLEHFYDL